MKIRVMFEKLLIFFFLISESFLYTFFALFFLFSSILSFRQSLRSLSHFFFTTTVTVYSYKHEYNRWCKGCHSNMGMALSIYHSYLMVMPAMIILAIDTVGAICYDMIIGRCGAMVCTMGTLWWS